MLSRLMSPVSRLFTSVEKTNNNIQAAAESFKRLSDDADEAVKDTQGFTKLLRDLFTPEMKPFPADPEVQKLLAEYIKDPQELYRVAQTLSPTSYSYGERITLPSLLIKIRLFYASNSWFDRTLIFIDTFFSHKLRMIQIKEICMTCFKIHELAQKGFEPADPQGFESQIPDQVIHKIIAAFVMAGSLIVYGKSPSESSTSKLVKQLGEKGRSLFGISQGVRASIQLFEAMTQLLDMVMKSFQITLGFNDIEAISPERFKKFITSVNCLDNDDTIIAFSFDAKLRAEVNHLKDECEEISIALGRVKSVPNGIMTQFMRSQGILTRIVHQMEKTSLNLGTKIDPFCLCLFGEPGIGKSVVNLAIINEIAKKRGVPKYKRIYARNVLDPYWSGYCHQFAVVMDDVSQFRESPNVDPYADIISIKTNSDFRLLMADVNEKGRLFTSSLLSMTTNAPYYRPMQMVEPNAFLRRRDLLVRVTRNPGVAFSKDMTFPHLSFDIFDKFESNKISGPHSFLEILNIIDERYDLHMNGQLDVTDMLSFKEKDIFERLSDAIEQVSAQPQAMGGIDLRLFDEYFSRYSNEKAMGYVKRQLFGGSPVVPRCNNPFMWIKIFCEDYADYVNDYYTEGFSWEEMGLNGPVPEKYIVFASYALYGKWIESNDETPSIPVYDGDYMWPNHIFDRLAINYYSGKSHTGTVQCLLDQTDCMSAVQASMYLKHWVDIRRVLARRFGNDCVLNPIEEKYYKPLLFLYSGRAMDGVDRWCVTEPADPQVAEASMLWRMALCNIKDPDSALRFPDKNEFDTSDCNIRAAYDMFVAEAGRKENICFQYGFAIYLCSRLAASDEAFPKRYKRAKDQVDSLIRSDKALEKRYVSFIVEGVTDEYPWEEIFSEHSSWWRCKLETFKLEHPILFALLKQIGIVLGMLAAFKTIKGVYSFCFEKNDDEETLNVEDAAQQMYNRAPVRRAAKAKKDVKIVRAVKQVDSNAEGIIESRVNNNIVRLWNLTANKSLSAFRVKGRVFITNKHFYHMCRLDDELIIQFVNKTEFRFRFDPAKWTWLEDSDLAMFDPGLQVPMGKDSTSLFLKDSDLQYVENVVAKLIGVTPGGNTIKMWQSRYIPNMKYYDLGQECKVMEGWTTNYTTEVGDCGSIMVHLNSRNPRKLAGIHSSMGSGNTSVVQLVTQEMLETLYESLSPSEIIPVDDGELPLDVVPAEQQMMDGNFTVEGLAPKYLATGTKTGIVMSPIHGTFPVTKAPSVLSSSDKRCKVPGDPLKRAVSKYGNVGLPFLITHLTLIASRLEGLFASFNTPRKPKVLTNSEAINGIPGYEYFDALDMKSSPGFPYTQMRPPNESGKAFIFDRIEHQGSVEYVPKPEFGLLSRMAAREDSYLQGKTFPSIWTDCLKDELRPVAKIVTGSTRSFCMAPLDYTVLCRKYFMDFCAAFYSNRLLFFSAVGIDPNGRDWTSLWNKLRACSDIGIAGDYSAWDGTVKPDCVAMIVNVINGWYNDGPQNALVRRMLIDEMIHTRSWCRRVIYQKHIGMPSGHPMTVIFNTIVNYVYLAHAWIDLAEEAKSKYRPLVLMDKFVSVAIYGDDNILAINPEVAEFYNQQSLTAYFSSYGVKYTDARKLGLVVAVQPLNSLTFLKSGFLQHAFNRNRMLSPIEPDTIFGVLNWITDSIAEGEAMRQNYRDALEFAYHHGRDYFESVRKSCVDKFRELSIEYDDYTFDDFDYLFGLKF